MEEKICTKCKKSKLLLDFYKSKSKSGKVRVYSCCKSCSYETNEIYRKRCKDKINERIRSNYKKNSDSKKRDAKNHAKRHPELIKLRWKRWYQKNKEAQILKAKKQYSENKKAISIRKNKRQKERWRTEPIFSIAHSLRTRVYRAFNQNRWNKGKSTEILLGTTYEIAKLYIERQFKKGMSWENRGDWHIDHKIPLASAKTEEELRSLCHYTNLQPLWATENLKKSNKILPIQTTLTI